MYKNLLDFIRELYPSNNSISLHEPVISSKEKKYIEKVLDTGFVSSVGYEVTEFENQIAEFVGSKYAIATSNGTAALHAALIVSGVQPNDEVITQSLTFIASSNAIHYCHANPVFIDVDRETLGLSPHALKDFLNNNCEIREDGFCWNKSSNRIIRACLPMHTFGLSAKIHEIDEICKSFNIILVEDAAESLGTFSRNKHTGTIGDFGVLSFNGNKLITTGGGGMVLTDDEVKAEELKHITTTARVNHKWEFTHDVVGYNYRMPNLNAALGLAQLENIEQFIETKRKIAKSYQDWGSSNNLFFVTEYQNTKSNYWLNTLILDNSKERDQLLSETNDASIMTRPAWNPMHTISFNKNFQKDSLKNTNWLFERIVNLPSSVKGSIYG